VPESLRAAAPDREPYAERVERAMQAVREAGAAALIASDFATVRWLCGRTVDIESGLAPWSAGTHVVLSEGGGVVICPSEDAGEFAPSNFEILAYEGFSQAPTFDPQGQLREALRKTLVEMGVGADQSICIEAGALPASTLPGLEGRPVRNLTTELRTLRARKDPAEVAAIRAAARLAVIGQQTFREGLEPGISEVELWSRVHAAMESAAGERVPVLVDLMFGDRCLEVGLPPSDRRLADDELGLCDLSPRYGGYWADSCATVCTGTPTAAMRRLHEAARRALDAGIRAARPGITGGQLDLVVRETMANAGYDYPHHSGHGVGASYHEEPRIVPNASVVLEDGMVVALEPGSYTDGVGLRVEHIFVVHEGGAELLTDHSLELS
jgi:Xaa-Pro dipeptidase